MNKALVPIFFLLLFIVTINLPKEANAREITNLQWKKSVAKGKKLSNFRETVTSPALGKKAWKITLLPKDCGRDNDGNYSDCKIMEKMLLWGMEEEIELEANILHLKNLLARNGFQ